MKVQPALRAFKAKDRQNIKKIAQIYPETTWYETEEIIAQRCIGVAHRNFTQ